jgi:ribosomal protein S18 acetylase RimI-like enzyme
MNMTLVERPRGTNEAHAIATLVTAFAADPAVRWMYPDSQQYLTHFPDFVRALGGKAFEHDTAEDADGFRCAALWLPPGVQPDEAAVVEVLQRSLEEERLPELFSLFEQMGAFHPNEPHWYLPMIGVNPSEQGRGVGSALLREGLTRCDADGLPAYLEATSLRNISLYERFGFEAVGRIQTKTSPPIIPMFRQPQP